MKAGCLSPDEIADLVRGLATIEDEHHITGCETCRRRVTLVRRAAAAGLARIADVAAEVDELVARLLTTPRVNWWKTVREPEYRRADVARRLLSLGVDARFKDRPLAVALAKAATTIADAIGDHDAADLRFETWKFASAILREAGRYAELPDAFSRADQAARRTSNPELAEASLCLSRALFYAEPDIWRPQEAAELLDRAERVFTECCEARLPAVQTARAFLLFRSGDLSRASDVFGTLVDATSSVRDLAYLDALSNWLWVRVESGEASSDVEHDLAYLVEQNTRCGRRVQVARARWMQGNVHSIRGQHDSAVQLFEVARQAIEDGDASIRIGLDAVRALLLTDCHRQAYALARELASAAVALDHREPSRRHTLTTQVLGYLREAAQREALTADLVVECSRYLDRITRQRAVEFIPPMSLTEM